MTERKRYPKRGFGSMDPERAREIQAQGGRTAASKKRTFCTHEGLASVAGRKSANRRYGKKEEPDVR